MAYSVFFREANEIFPANNFIYRQPSAHRNVLQTVADSLAIGGSIDHPSANKNSKGEWSVLITDNGDNYIYTLFISHFEKEESKGKAEQENRKVRQLVIIDPNGPKDSVGGYHPGYWSSEHYASLLEEEQRNLLLETVSKIKHDILSEDYSVNPDRSFSIHIIKKGKAYTIAVTCRAEWR